MPCERARQDGACRRWNQARWTIRRRCVCRAQVREKRPRYPTAVGLLWREDCRSKRPLGEPEGPKVQVSGRVRTANAIRIFLQRPGRRIPLPTPEGPDCPFRDQGMQKVLPFADAFQRCDSRMAPARTATTKSGWGTLPSLASHNLTPLPQIRGRATPLLGRSFLGNVESTASKLAALKGRRNAARSREQRIADQPRLMTDMLRRLRPG